MWYPLIFFPAAMAAASSTKWRPGELNVTQILLDKKVEVDVTSELVCALVASRVEPPVSYCYDAPLCIIANGSFLTNQSVGVDNMQCKFLPKCCAYPYMPVGVDCVPSVTIIEINTPLPASRAACIAIGSELFSPGTPENTLAMEADLRVRFGVGIYHWTDAMLVGGEWRWNAGTGRLIDASEWGTPPANPATKQCAYLRTGAGLVEEVCSQSWWPLCVKSAPLCI